MLTTALMTFSATSAMPSGPREKAGEPRSGIVTIAAAAAVRTARPDARRDERRHGYGKPSMGDGLLGKLLLTLRLSRARRKSTVEYTPQYAGIRRNGDILGRSP